MPSYSSECEGTRASCFKAKVTVGERFFESLKFFNSSKEAENAAAQAALMSLLVENYQKASSFNLFSILFNASVVINIMSFGLDSS